MKTYILTFYLFDLEKAIEVDKTFRTEQEKKEYIEFTEKRSNALCIDEREV